ncbi:transcription factor FapR [Caldanaerobius polysaccharolyticus]|uniref:transcription factor FapR n=1 Tax=Caldanaerobius polysaccharolyticus TaxID=44256 RepID=UPI00047A7767|nr:transcription factor FapR [Caldanaerobius polysaccharolyticus]
MKRALSKSKRHEEIRKMIAENPFLTDESLAEALGVSIQTIRLDRMEMGIPEQKERIKSVAENKFESIRALAFNEIVGQLVNFKLGEGGTSVFQPSKHMAFEKSGVIKGQYIYAQAESLAISVIDADVALIGVANIKYKHPVYSGDTLVATAEVIRKRGNKYFVWVKIKKDEEEVFRGKFILVSLDDRKER